MKKLLKNIVIGLALSSMLNTIFSLIFTTGKVQFTIMLYLIFGLVVGASTTIYQSEKLPLLIKTLIQLTTIFTSFILIAYFGDWFPFKFSILCIAVIFFLLIFFLIWSIVYVMEKREIKRMNETINKGSKPGPV